MKICFISDTHGERPKLPDADLLVHCGDLTMNGNNTQFDSAIEWFKEVRSRYRYGI